MSISHTVKTLVTGTPVLLTGGVPGSRAGDDRLIFNQPEFAANDSIAVTSSAFTDGGTIPTQFSADGQNISPPIAWANPPAGTQSVVLIVEDPDAPLPNPFVHWLAYEIDPTKSSLPEGVPTGESNYVKQGKNSGLKTGWTGMAPPKGDTPHHYHFQVFALNGRIDLKADAGRSALVSAIEGKVLAKGRLIGTYQR